MNEEHETRAIVPDTLGLRLAEPCCEENSDCYASIVYQPILAWDVRSHVCDESGKFWHETTPVCLSVLPQDWAIFDKASGLYIIPDDCEVKTESECIAILERIRFRRKQEAL